MCLFILLTTSAVTTPTMDSDSPDGYAASDALTYVSLYLLLKILIAKSPN